MINDDMLIFYPARDDFLSRWACKQVSQLGREIATIIHINFIQN